MRLAVRSAPTVGSLQGLKNIVCVLLGLIFHDALSMADAPDEGLYRLIDIRSAVFIIRTLTKSAYIKSWSLNTRQEPLAKLAELLGLDPTTRKSDRYSGAGLFNIAFHYARSAVASSIMYRDFCANTAASGSAPSDLQLPDVVYDRVVYGLATAFYLPQKVVKSVLGTVEECSAVRTHKWLPEMKWVGRDVKDSGVVLWPSVHDRAFSVERQLIAMHTLPKPLPYNPNAHGHQIGSAPSVEPRQAASERRRRKDRMRIDAQFVSQRLLYSSEDTGSGSECE